MIVSFANSETAAVWRREYAKRFGADLQRAALRKLLILDAAEDLNDLRTPPEIGWRCWRGVDEDNTASGSTSSSGSAFAGQLLDLLTWR